MSVVTPCLNPGWRLARCIDAIKAQIYDRVEHVVIDGGSTDGTADLLQAAQVTRWISEPDEGQTDALNKGFRMCRGEIVGWIGADDSIRPDGIEAVVATLRSSPGAGWAYGDVQVSDGSGSWTFRPPDAVTLSDFELNNPIAQPGAFLRATVLARIGELDRQLHFAMDMALWMRLLDDGIPGAYAPQILADFEVHDESKGGSGVFDRFLDEAGLLRLKYGLEGAAAATAGRVAALRSRRPSEEDIVAALAGIGCNPSTSNVNHARASAVAQRAIQGGAATSLIRSLVASPEILRDRYARRLVAGTIRSSFSRLSGRPVPQRW